MQASPGPSALNSVTVGAGLFVAVGDNGIILTSSDGRTWTAQASGSTDHLRSIAFGNGRFVATKASSTQPAITSVDGKHWQPVTVKNAAGVSVESGANASIAFGGGRFMAVGSADRFVGNEVMVSADGVSFQTLRPVIEPYEPYYMKRVGYFQDRFVVSDDNILLSSTDETSWRRFIGGSVIATDNARRVASIGSFAGVFSIDGGRNFERSDLLMDYYRETNRWPRIFTGMVFGGDSFVAVDDNGFIWTSRQGEYWLPRHLPGSSGLDELRGIACNGSRFVVVGSGGLIASAEADPPSPVPPAYHVTSLKDLSGARWLNAYHITNGGAIAGSILNSAGVECAAVFREGIVTTYPYAFARTYALATSDTGITPVVIFVTSSLTWSIVQPAGVRLFGDATISVAGVSINASGVLVGNYRYGDTFARSGVFRYDTSTGQMTELGRFGNARLYSSAINDVGDIAGTVVPEESTTGYEYHRAFRLSAAGEMTILPTLGGSDTYGAALNASGAVAGSASMPLSPGPLETHAFLFRDGTISDIDTLNSSRSRTNGINARTEVVGSFDGRTSSADSGNPERAFYYRDGVMHDLNTLLDQSGDGWVLTSANGINSAGAIVGNGWRRGQQDSFVAVPVPGPPAGVQTRFVNVSTRLWCGTGDDVSIGGFILRGAPKRVVVRALGPALGNLVPDALADPMVELFNAAGQRIAANDDYALLSAADRLIISSHFLEPPWPSNGRDSALIVELPAGAYTAVVRGKNGTVGNCLIEVYNIDSDYGPALANISTRGRVRTGDNVLIGGFIIRGDRERRVLVRAIGPSLAGLGVSGALADPTLEIHDRQGRIAQNNDWRELQEAEIIASGLAPNDNREAASIQRLWPGNYTAIVRGNNDTAGNALVEVYELPDVD